MNPFTTINTAIAEFRRHLLGVTKIERFATVANFPTTGSQYILYLAEDTDILYTYNGTYKPSGSGGGASFSQVTADYNLQESDNGKIVYVNSATPTILTIPLSLSLGFNCTIANVGAGDTTVDASAVTNTGSVSLTITQTGSRVVHVHGSNVVHIFGGS